MLRWVDRLAVKVARRYLKQRTLSMAKTLPKARGRITVSFEQYNRLLDEATRRGSRKLVDGWSPGFVAHALCMSRQAVHVAVDRGTLTAYYVTDDETGDLAAIIITEASVNAYKAKNRAA